MATYPPPTETLPIFDAGVFTTNDTTLTIAQADARYLKFPTGQGTETLPALVMSGAITLGTNNIKLTNATSNFYTNNNSNPITTGGNNCMIGLNCGSAITTGGTNTGLGFFDTFKTLTSGNANTAIGFQSLQVVNTTNNNTALGYQSGLLTTGSNNTFIGTSADTTSASASQCTAIGYQSSCGASNTTALGHATIASGASSTAVGHNATTAGFARSTAIGYNSAATAVDQVVLGSSSQSVIIPRNIRYLNSPMVAWSLNGGSQSIANNSPTTINYSVADARNGTATGITNSSGTFTNSNSYSVTLSVSACISIDSNAAGTRFFTLVVNGNSICSNLVQPSASDRTCMVLSSTFVLNASETFYCLLYQTSGVALNAVSIGDKPSRISILVM